MIRGRQLSIAIVLAAVVVVAVVALALSSSEETRVRRAVADYDTALANALYELDPDGLKDVAAEREIQRVASYITGLWGSGYRMESDLLDVQVLEIESAESTITVRVREEWRYVRRDLETGEQVGEMTEIEQFLRYTLVPRDGRLVVYLSELENESLDD